MSKTDNGTVYDFTPVVAELNRVPGFDPLNFLRKVRDGYVLDLPYKKLWFRTKYPNGKIRLLPLKITEQLAIIEARVFFDRRDAEPAASFIAQRETNGKANRYIEEAQNFAMDSALTDAGFGIQFIPSNAESGTASPVPINEMPTMAAEAERIEKKAQDTHADTHVEQSADIEARSMGNAAPAAVVATDIPRDSETSADVSEEAIPTPEPAADEMQKEAVKVELADLAALAGTAAKQQTTESEANIQTSADEPAYNADMPVEEIIALMTQKEAENYVVKEGTCAGWSMATVLERRPASLRFYLTGYTGKDNVLRAAATILSQQKAA